jgi:hypothetical protein
MPPSRAVYFRAALAALVVAVLAICIGLFGSHHHLLMRHAPASMSQASDIRPWMTFDYVNHLFGLPPAYLQAALGITDPRYPHLTISEFFEHESPGEQPSSLDAVQDAVRAYLSNEAP